MAIARVGHHSNSPFVPQSVLRKSMQPEDGSNRHPPEVVSYATTVHFGQATGAMNEPYHFSRGKSWLRPAWGARTNEQGGFWLPGGIHVMGWSIFYANPVTLVDVAVYFVSWTRGTILLAGTLSATAEAGLAARRGAA